MSKLYVRESRDSVDNVGARLEAAAAAHRFGVLNVIDLKEKLAAKGVDLGPCCRIYEVCNPVQAKRVLDHNLTVSTALPCRVSVYEEGGKVMVATILPTEVLGMFGSPELLPIAEEMEAGIKAMIDESVSV
jgi:uncharacterized protein (DUF302 family)